MPDAPAAVRALRILRVLAAAHGPLAAGQVAERVGAPRASTYRLLAAMAAEGFVVRFPDERRWGLGLATFEVGSAYLRREPLERLARPVLMRLVARARRTAHLGVLDGPELLYLVVERPRRPDPLVTAVGVRLPSQRTASGRALLAVLPPEQLRAAFSRTGVPPELDDLAADAARGWSREVGLVTPGYGSVAAPVVDATGRAVAAVSLTAPVLGAHELDPLVAPVVEAAAAVSRRLA